MPADSLIYRIKAFLGTRIQEAETKRELAELRREVEILRNEILENVAAIHRLEIVTMHQQLALLNSFGKALTPTTAGKTKESFKTPGYSFGIITNGKRPDQLNKLMDSLRSQGLSKDGHEILVAGYVAKLKKSEGLRTYPMEEAADQGRLGAMRNVLARESRFNKFVSLDDDLLLHPKWVEAVEQVHDDFDLATGIIVNPDLSRYCDWVNSVAGYTYLRGYREGFDPECQYVTGGYGIYKDYLFTEHSWNGNLGFYQGEDLQFSRSLFDSGYRLKFIPGAMVMHDDDQYTQKGYGVVRLKSWIKPDDPDSEQLRLDKLCPRTLT